MKEKLEEVNEEEEERERGRREVHQKQVKGDGAFISECGIRMESFE